MRRRLIAFSWHLLGSLVVLTLLCALIYKVWYPTPFFTGDGGIQGMQLLAGVDIFLGPFLTLIICSSKKSRREFKRDMGVILLIQGIALAGGTALVYQQRPMLVVFADSYFRTMSSSALEAANVPEEVLKQLLAQDRPFAYVDVPDDYDKDEAGEFNGKLAIFLFNQGDRYIPLGSRAENRILKVGFDLSTMLDKLPDKRADVTRIVNELSGDISDYVLVPLFMRYKNISFLVHKRSGLISGNVDIDRFELSYADKS